MRSTYVDVSNLKPAAASLLLMICWVPESYILAQELGEIKKDVYDDDEDARSIYVQWT